MYSPVYPYYTLPNYNQPNYSNSVLQQNVQTQQGSSINWVLGENAAKSFPVGAGQTVVLMDREEPVMYMKSVDQSGMPLPLRIFDITERTAQHTETVVTKSETPDYVSRSEFDKFKEDVRQTIKNMRKPKNDEVKDNGKPVL